MNNKTEKNQRNRRTIKISETLKDIVDLSSSKSNKLEFIVNAQWPEIVGNFFAEHSEPYKLNIINKNNNYNQNSLYQGILEVKITPAAAIEFQHFNDKIIEKINSYFGYQAIKGIKIHQQYVKNEKSVKGKKNVNLVQQEKDKIKIRKLTPSMSNKELEESIVKLGLSIKKEE